MRVGKEQKPKKKKHWKQNENVVHFARNALICSFTCIFYTLLTGLKFHLFHTNCAPCSAHINVSFQLEVNSSEWQKQNDLHVCKAVGEWLSATKWTIENGRKAPRANCDANSEKPKCNKHKMARELYGYHCVLSNVTLFSLLLFVVCLFWCYSSLHLICGCSHRLGTGDLAVMIIKCKNDECTAHPNAYKPTTETSRCLMRLRARLAEFPWFACKLYNRCDQQAS